MHKLVINKLGPIEQCELGCTGFMTLTGFQASGKSTIAKAIYYFRTIKEDIAELAKQQAISEMANHMSDVESGNIYEMQLRKKLENHLREKFLNTFGSSWGMQSEMYMEYHFTETCYIRISLKNDNRYRTPNYIWLTFSEALNEFLQEKNNYLSITPLGVPEEELKFFKAELCKLFDDYCSVVYIPAGRSMITLLSQQFNYIYAQMDDVQKRSLDSCTRNYLERILRIKPEFSDGLEGLIALYRGKDSISESIISQALKLIKKTLRGSYRYSNGEEQILLDNEKYVKLNFSSSGQQESVWILNLLFYYLLQRKQILFIIEEPESHLFPESQKYITELISLVNNCGHSIVLTTHSPYVLGTLNNLLYAHEINLPQYVNQACNIIPKELWLDFHNFESWFVKNGRIENCMDPEIHMIQNERIDEISNVINDDFDRLLEIQNEIEEGAL